MNGATMRLGKRAFRTEREARNGTRLRVYECPICGGFHRTSKPRRRRRKGFAW
jgi:hypothetical protein